ncbi:hypothetical protein MiAbW_03191 [Microcystis aeruginosa NIES-4325]|uniref:PEP-CTERM protein-sorting domain-containing protein n=1 Tax=Microcystis aeruginosa NIES-4325 TaxID=2569534 RepID=A0A5J4FDQ5_MICAE|nr:PEP-CTERM sorting domain-containing protein [Microcystis aeruginosa]GEA28615.1 hypothetical protein MiAbW_03191 [Microcystis aeruginosa NIES-4325]
MLQWITFALLLLNISGDIGNVSTPEPSGVIGLGILGGGLVVRSVAKRR